MADAEKKTTEGKDVSKTEESISTSSGEAVGGAADSAASCEADSISKALAYMEKTMKDKLKLSEGTDEAKPEQVLSELNLKGIAEYIKSGRCRNIITMAGAGISTSAGIPDFRSPGSGLYDNLQKYNLPAPEAMFEINFFKENPEPFFELARELWPGKFQPTPCHYFLRLLHEKGLLLRHYTQNIDTLELIAGLPEDKVVEAHGSFAHAHCLECKAAYTKDWMQDQILKGSVPKCQQTECNGVVKPDIVFFGEALPPRFFQCAQQDFSQCDLLLVMGTSLVVQPFASLTGKVKDRCPRAYFNMEEPPASNAFMVMLGMGHDFGFNSSNNYRDVFHKGTCDETCSHLAEHLGWKDDFAKLITTETQPSPGKTTKSAGSQGPAGEKPGVGKQSKPRTSSTGSSPKSASPKPSPGKASPISERRNADKTTPNKDKASL